MADYVLIGTDEPFEGEIPDPLILPIFKEDPTPHEELDIVNKGDPDYDEGLKRWMFLHGYATPEDNRREMQEEPA